MSKTTYTKKSGKQTKRSRPVKKSKKSSTKKTETKPKTKQITKKKQVSTLAISKGPFKKLVKEIAAKNSKTNGKKIEN